MNDVELIRDLITKQRKLDVAMIKASKTPEKYIYTNIKSALFDELGEVNHELKAEWCWWKKTQKPVDRNKLLEELADAWHFAVIIFYNFATIDIIETGVDRARGMGAKYNLETLMTMVVDSAPNIVILSMYLLTDYLGFTMQEIHDAYIEKDKENYDRIERGY